MIQYLVIDYGETRAFKLTVNLNRLAGEGWMLDHIAGAVNQLYIFSRNITPPPVTFPKPPTKYSQLWSEDDKGDIHP